MLLRRFPFAASVNTPHKRGSLLISAQLLRSVAAHSWEYLHHGDWQMLQIRAPLLSTPENRPPLNIYQHLPATAVVPTGRVWVVGGLG